MKTQTIQLSLLETEQVTGGLINLEAPIEYVTTRADVEWLHGLLPPNLNITLSTREDGGKFEIMK